jgi:hypothetical protein
MAKHSNVRLLEVAVTAEKPELSKWQIIEQGEEVARGLATSGDTAQIDGDSLVRNALTCVIEKTRRVESAGLVSIAV